MHEDAAQKRRHARDRAKTALMEAAAAEVAAANTSIDNLKREVALKWASRSRPPSALIQAEGGWNDSFQSPDALSADS
jgi:predicted aspartyl protease